MNNFPSAAPDHASCLPSLLAVLPCSCTPRTCTSSNKESQLDSIRSISSDSETFDKHILDCDEKLFVEEEVLIQGPLLGSLPRLLLKSSAGMHWDSSPMWF